MWIKGTNRLFYQAAGFVTELTVTGKLFTGDFTLLQEVNFTEWQEGTYYVDIVFPSYATFIMRVYEGGIHALTETFQVDRPWMQKGIIVYRGKDLEFPDP